jgi:hypothetical protein
MLFSAFMCARKYCAAGDKDGCKSEESVLAADDRISCQDSSHVELQNISILVIACFAIGIPVMFFALLVRKSTRVTDVTVAQKDWLATELSSPLHVVESLARRVQVGNTYGFIVDAYKSSACASTSALNSIGLV